jgi:DNA end-binding protein Ku
VTSTAWKGAISIGLLVIPVKLYGTTRDTRTQVHQVTEDGTRIEHRRVKKGTSTQVPWGEVRKGAELANGQVVVLDDEEWRATLPGDAKSITVLGVVAARSAPAGDGTTRWAHPDTGGEKAYSALALALARRREALVARIVLKDREHLAVITAREGRLWVATIPWPEDLLAPDLDAPDAVATPAEVSQMGDLLGAQPQGFTWASHPEPQRTKVEALINATIQRGKGPAPMATMPATDLGALLRQAVEQARQDAGTSRDGAPAPASPEVIPLPGKSARKSARPAPASQGAPAGRRAG